MSTPTLPPDDPAVQAALQKMTAAFHEFHDHIVTLKAQEHDIAKSLRREVDAAKLATVQAQLQQALDR